MFNYVFITNLAVEIKYCTFIFLSMRSFQQAISIIEQQQIARQTQSVCLLDSLGCYLAQDLFAPISLPPFTQSAMDGYAFIRSDLLKYRLVGENKAGDLPSVAVQNGEAVRIFTGAAMPETADTVVMQEKVIRQGDNIAVLELPIQGANVRKSGEQLEAGALVFKKHTYVNERTIGMLAAMGMAQVPVFQRPKVSLMTTGNELQIPGQPLSHGQIYDTNTYLLQAALKQLSIQHVVQYRVKDQLNAVIHQLEHSLSMSDVVIISGGISVGDYDYVGQALQACGVSCLFYKVAQKPGKPIWVGRKEERWIFALPGNPASTLTCYYLYVLPILKRILGAEEFHLPRGRAKLLAPLSAKGHRTLFLKAKVYEGKAEILEGQSSAMIHSFTEANALVMVPADIRTLQPGDWVEYIALNRG